MERYRIGYGKSTSTGVAGIADLMLNLPNRHDDVVSCNRTSGRLLFTCMGQ
jgi:hypothetical protein